MIIICWHIFRFKHFLFSTRRLKNGGDDIKRSIRFNERLTFVMHCCFVACVRFQIFNQTSYQRWYWSRCSDSHFSDGVFWDFEKLLVLGHDAGHASEDEHAAVGTENRRSGRVVAAVQVVGYERGARRVHNGPDTGNYKSGPVLNVEPHRKTLVVILVCFLFVKFTLYLCVFFP